MSIVAEKIGAKPFMEYAQSYALYNYQKKDVDVCSNDFNEVAPADVWEFEADQELSEFTV